MNSKLIIVLAALLALASVNAQGKINNLALFVLYDY